MHENYLEKIKYKLLKTNSAETFYYANMLFSMKTEWTERIKTAAVDGRTLFVNGPWFMALTEDEAVGLVAHEMCHPIYQHLTTFPFFDRKVFEPAIEWKLWNEAGDHAINLKLIESGYTLPSGGLWDDRFIGMATVEIYRILHDEYEVKPWDLGDGDMIPIPGDGAGSERAIDALEVHIKKTMIKAAMATEMNKTTSWGSAPAHIQRLLQKVQNPQLDFPTMLWNYMSKYKYDDYSYRRPNRRYIQQNIYMPTLRSEALCDLAFVFDLSGSVDDHTLSIFHRALWMVKEQLNPDKITLIQFDTDVFQEDVITDTADIMKIKFGGGGGTEIDPVIEWINENKPEVTLIFTDGYFDEQRYPTTTDIIWIIQDNRDFTAPQGRIIHHDM